MGLMERIIVNKHQTHTKPVDGCPLCRPVVRPAWMNGMRAKELTTR